MKVYSPNDMAMMLEIKPATLRKYSALLEKNGYHIERNSQNHRYYQDKDIIAIRNVIRGANGDVTLEQSVKNVVLLENGKRRSDLTNDTNSGELTNGSDIAELKEMIHKQSELIQKQSKITQQQNEVMKKLTDRLDQQQDYISNSINERDKTLMITLNEMMEAKKQIGASEEEKKGFFTKLFKK